MTITEKVMALNSGRDSVLPGELVWVNVNSVMTMDYLGKQCFKAFESLSPDKKLFDKNKVICVSDHLVPHLQSSGQPCSMNGGNRQRL
ncbi:MAG: hypothetical protein IPO37_03280 [Saprospiraceae bacterium]|nr:hypothetical protein [Saprospiraceae bacterium]